MTVPPEVLTVLATCNVAVLGYMAKQISNLAKKIDSMVCEPLCKERSEKCRLAVCSKIKSLEDEDDKLWKRIHGHDHTSTGQLTITHHE